MIQLTKNFTPVYVNPAFVQNHFSASPTLSAESVKPSTDAFSRRNYTEQAPSDTPSVVEQAVIEKSALEESRETLQASTEKRSAAKATFLSELEDALALGEASKAACPDWMSLDFNTSCPWFDLSGLKDKINLEKYAAWAATAINNILAKLNDAAAWAMKIFGNIIRCTALLLASATSKIGGLIKKVASIGNLAGLGMVAGVLNATGLGNSILTDPLRIMQTTIGNLSGGLLDEQLSELRASPEYSAYVGASKSDLKGLFNMVSGGLSNGYRFNDILGTTLGGGTSFIFGADSINGMLGMSDLETYQRLEHTQDRLESFEGERDNIDGYGTWTSPLTNSPGYRTTQVSVTSPTSVFSDTSYLRRSVSIPTTSNPMPGGKRTSLVNAKPTLSESTSKKSAEIALATDHLVDEKTLIMMGAASSHLNSDASWSDPVALKNKNIVKLSQDMGLSYPDAATKLSHTPGLFVEKKRSHNENIAAAIYGPQAKPPKPISKDLMTLNTKTKTNSTKYDVIYV